MKREVSTRKKRFAAFCLAFVLVFYQLMPIKGNAADYTVSESELYGKTVQAGDTLTYSSEGTGTYSIYYQDYEGNLLYTGIADYNGAYTVLGGSDVNLQLPTDASFAGWYVNEVYASSGVLYSVTLRAMIAYPVTYVLAGGTNAASNPTSYIYGNGAITLGAATKAGYTFGGWYTDENFTTEFTSLAEDQTGVLTLYAKFTQNSSYQISYELDGGSIAGDYPTSYIEGLGTELVDATKTGYTFGGWYDDAGFINQVTSISATETGDVTLYAKFTVNSYTITFDTAGGSTIEAITQDYGTAVTAPANPTRDGYTFAGWDKTIPSTMPAENITITASWTANQYTITFDTAGGSNVAAITQDYGTAVTAPANPTRDGYTFAGWDKTIPATMPAENITITASWTANTYAINYELAGGANGNNPSGYTYGEGVTSFADASKAGYRFAGWYSDAEFKNPVISISTTATGNITLYAKFDLYLIGKGTYYLEQGVQYQLDSGVTLVSGDSSVYGAGITFYVPTTGTYTFE